MSCAFTHYFEQAQLIRKASEQKWAALTGYRMEGTEDGTENKAPTFDINAFRAELKEELLADVNKAITGSSGRIKRDLEASLPDAVATKLDLKGQLTELFSQYLPKTQGNETPPVGSTVANATQSGSTAQDDKLSEFMSSFESLRQQNEATQKQNQTLMQQFKASEEARLSEQTARKRMEVQQKFYSQVSDKVQDPEQFLLSLEHFGGVVEKDGSFGVIQKDNFGEEVFTQVADKVDDLLKLPRFAIHAKPRPGNGLGSSPNNGKPAGTPQSQFFGENAPSPDALGKIATTQGGFENLMADLLKSAQ